MNAKPNEWVAVADLMSGVLAVVALMLVVALLISRQQAAERSVKPPVDELEGFLRDFERKNTDPAIRVNVGDLRIWLADGAFDRASACLLPHARQSLESWRAAFPQHLLASHGRFKLTIEIGGYTDSNPVTGQVNDASKCAKYHDNVGLSVARATTSREELIKGLSPVDARQFVVAGYGDTRLLPNLDSADPRNRRVEVRFVVAVRQAASAQ